MLGISRKRQLTPGSELSQSLARDAVYTSIKIRSRKKISSSILSSRAREPPFAVAPMTGS